MKLRPQLISLFFVALAISIILDVIFVEGSKAEKKRRPNRQLRRKKEKRPSVPRGAYWKGSKLRAKESGIIKWHVSHGTRVEKGEYLLTIQWSIENADGEEEDCEEGFAAPWPGKVLVYNLAHKEFSERGKTILELLDL